MQRMTSTVIEERRVGGHRPSQLRRAHRDEIAWRRIVHNLERECGSHGARVWINGKEVEPESKFDHLSRRYD